MNTDGETYCNVFVVTFSFEYELCVFLLFV